MVTIEPAAVSTLATLRKRSDFLAANGGLRVATPAFVLLVRIRPVAEDAPADPVKRIGITVTKKIGNAVARNRMKRRFRALAQAVMPEHGIAGADHVLIGRSSDTERDFALLQADLIAALERVRSGKAQTDRYGGRRPPKRGNPKSSNAK